jgi:hypothetical protein
MFFDEELMRLHREKLLKEAEGSRLIAQTRQRSSQRRYHYAVAFTWLGIRLSRWGELLQKRFGEVQESTPCSESIHSRI